MSKAPALLLALTALVAVQSRPRDSFRVEISFPASLRTKPVDGRVYLMLARKADPEPRFQIGEDLDTQQFFGADVDGLAPGAPAVMDGGTPGYPIDSFADVPTGEYFVQALLHPYETFHRSDGHVIRLPMDQGEGQLWNKAPGSLYSQPKKMRVSADTGALKIELDKIIPPVVPPRDTRYVKHFRIKSKLLSKFWGRPMFLGGVVLLPQGFEEHPNARYPVVYYHDHFTPTFETPVEFRTEPPDPKVSGYEYTVQEYSYRFYQDWTLGGLPRVLIVSIQHANPYYDDSYAVNSANLGPYGDAIVHEFIPYVEERFRAIGQPWARVLTGGSTGGWEALAQQVFYPDLYNGAWCNCPDPIDFRAYQLVNIYEDRNAFWPNSDWKKVPRPSSRKPDGSVFSTEQEDARREAVLGSHGRSTDQLDVWQAVYGPAGDDGYPKPIFDKRTGVIDHGVAEYWKQHYDLSYIIRRDWKTLGPKLIGKLHIKVGEADTYYLDRAVRLLQDFLESTKEPEHQPYYAGDFEYGPGKEHCYSGDPAVPVPISRLTINQRFLPQMAERMLKTAPTGADVKSWRY